MQTQPQTPENKIMHYWYCPHCKCEVDGANVTYEELHDSCGHHVEAKQVIQTPEILSYSTTIPLTKKVKAVLAEIDDMLLSDKYTEEQKSGIRFVKATTDIWLREEIKAIKNNQI